MKENRYLPDDHDTLMQAFKVLDTDNTGLIDEQVMIEALTSNNYAFHDKEIELFLSVAKDVRTGKINYEKYVCGMLAKLI
mmetsp:Transcript_983/g.1372  ORF Transcript_983/g.1372 Transcript_983/m.1372 type:complete len:80 (+) Transcript_983:2-241(+)